MSEQGVVDREDVNAGAEELRTELKQTLDALREKMDTGVYEDPTVTQVGTGEMDRSAKSCRFRPRSRRST